LDPRCDPAFVSWRASACGTPPCTTITRTGGANLDSYSCTVAGTPTTLTCTLNYYTSFLAPPTNMTFTLAAVANNAGMALRQLNDSVPINGVDLANIRPGPPAYGYCLLGSPGCTVGSSTINADGSATVNISAAIPPDAGTPLGINLLCGILSLIFNIPCYQHSQTITVPMALLSDHELVDPGNANPPVGGIDHAWFFRNKWHELSYYAVAGGIAPSGARSCTTSVNCLRVSYHPNDGKQRGIIILGGAKIGNQLRPPTAAIMTPADLLEGANADGTSPFALRAPALITDRSFNDHLVVVDTN
jgi:hypothetical protein